MKNITETQLALQRQLELQLAEIYRLDKQLSADSKPASQSLTTLEQELLEEVKRRSLVLTRHLARNEYATKELIRLEVEYEQLQASKGGQEQELSRLQNTVAVARRQHERLKEHTQSLQQETSALQEKQATLGAQKEELEQTLAVQRSECADLELEVENLRKKAKHLQQNIDGLLQMREHDMLSVMDLTARLSDVSSGKE